MPEMIDFEEAKGLALRIWRYFLEHPEKAMRKETDLPEELFAEVHFYDNYCPLCELYFYGLDDANSCIGCPLDRLGIKSGNRDTDWRRWSESGDGEVELRQILARRIIERIEAWELLVEQEKESA